MASKIEKKRLDILLVEKELFETRQKAQSAIMAGLIFVNDKKEDKAGTKIPQDARIEVKGNTCPYVSRGGYKLEKALKEFDININNAVCIDAGASTGGFTDCLLQNGASLIFSIDVGYGQLDWKIRNNPKVKVFERVNIRHMLPDELYTSTELPKASVCVADLSFISVTKVIGNILNLMDNDKSFIILIKPQFEAGKEQVSKNGIVKNKDVHIEVIKKIRDFSTNIGLKLSKLTFSPITGTTGNIEYLAYITNNSLEISISDDLIIDTVKKANDELR